MKTRHSIRLLATLLIIVAASGTTTAQVVEERIALQTGWNAIAIHVDPVEKDPALVFADVQVESLWTFVEAAEGSEARWVSYRPEAPDFLNSLHSVMGGRAYLVEARRGGTLRVSGLPVLSDTALNADTYQLMRADVDPGLPPTVEDYFSPTDADAISGIFTLDGPAFRTLDQDETLNPGRAYWVLSDRPIEHPHTIRILAGSGGFRFDDRTPPQTLQIELPPSTTPQQITLRARVEPGAPTPDWLQVETAPTVFTSLSTGVTVNVPVDTTLTTLLIRAERPGIDLDQDLAATLEIVGPNGARARLVATLVAPRPDGIWVGEAIVDSVSSTNDLGGELASAPSVTVPLILSLQANGDAELLDRYVLEGSRDGNAISVRFSSTVLHAPVALSGNVGAGGSTGTLSGVSSLGASHVLNPYRHQDHPEHRAGYDVSRAMTLRFAATDPDSTRGRLALTSIGTLVGSYEEEISGLTPDAIRVSGSFRLRRVADVP